MSMPQDLVFIRHGQSEANAMRHIGDNVDESIFTDDVMTIPDNSWRLTEKGVKQAQTAGKYLKETFGSFDRNINSPFIRTRETAAHLDLNGSLWTENRIIRERSWGEIDSMSKARFKKEYPHNYQLMLKDPIYWTPPAGESLAEVAENRASNFLRSLSRDAAGSKVIAVTHGEFITASRMIIEQWSDHDFYNFGEDPTSKIKNCAMVHYTRRNPETQELASKLRWVRVSYPKFIQTPDSENRVWTIIHEEWREFERKTLTSSELMSLIELQSRRFTEGEIEI